MVELLTGSLSVHFESRKVASTCGLEQDVNTIGLSSLANFNLLDSLRASVGDMNIDIDDGLIDPRLSV